MSLAMTLVMAVTCGFAHRLIAESEPVQQPGYLEFRVYTAVSNKLEAVVERFRETVDPVRRRLGIATLGYWSAPGTTNGGTFAYLLAATNREALQQQEKLFGADPQFQAGYASSTRKHGATVEKIVSIPLTVAPGAVPDLTAGSPPRTFDLRVYSIVPGKLEAFQARWRDHAVRIYKRHGMQPVGWWVAGSKDADGHDQFVCLMAGESRESILRSIAGFHRDPEWVRVEEETEMDGKLRSGVTSWKLTPTDFSRLK